VLRQLDARSAAQNGSSASNLYAGIDLISDALPFGRLWYGEPNAMSNAIGYAKHCSRSHDAVIRVYDEAGSMIQTHGHKASSKNRLACSRLDCERCCVRLAMIRLV
jgi:hypothetical protein